MISIDSKGTISVEGTKLDLMAELTVIMRSMLDQQVIDADDLKGMVDMALTDKKKLEKDFREARELIALASLLFGDVK